MIVRDDLQDWVIRALKDNGGQAKLSDVAKHIWSNHGDELQGAGDNFYTWQYDMRWAATKLRKRGKLKQSARTTAEYGDSPEPI
jgi:hypothetical protein